MIRYAPCLPALCCVALLAASPAMAQSKWIAAWGASPESTWAPEGDQPALHDTTLRMVVSPDQLGHSARFHLSNLLGTAPLVIDDAAVSLALAGPTPSAAQVPHSGHAILFKGKRGVTLAAGEEVWSDAVALNFIGVPSDARILGHALSVNLHVAGALGPVNRDAGGTSFASGPGPTQAATDAEAPFVQRIDGTLVIDAMDIMAPSRTQVVAIVGERLAEPGDGWAQMLARRILLDDGDRATLVDLTRESGRVAGLFQQLDRDPPSGVSTIILIAGLADVSVGGATPEATAEALGILARRTRARAPGIRLVGATLPPGPEGMLPADQDRSRRALNQFIRLTDVFDAVIDLDAAVADPASGWLRAGYILKGSNVADYGGQLAMANAVDLKTVVKPPPPPPPAPKAPAPSTGDATN